MQAATYVGVSVCWFTLIISVQQKHIPAATEKKTAKKAIYFWSGATAFSEKISKAEHNIVSTDCDANKAEKQ